MKGDTEGDPALWIQPHDKHGKPIDERLLDSAQRNWRRVRSYAERQGQDASIAADALETVVAYLSSLFVRHPHFKQRIKNLDDYVYSVAVHELNRLRAKEPQIEYVGSLDDLKLLQGAHDSSWAARLEREILLKEAKGYLKVRTRYLFSLRDMLYSWEDIAGSLGTTVNNVQSQFSQGIAQARRRILGRKCSKKGPTPKPGRSE